MPDVEFGSRHAANAFREEHPDTLCSQDDRRKKTVTLASDVSDRVLDEATIKAGSSRNERSDRGGQVPLEDHEKNRIEFSEDRASVPHARSVKGLMLDAGVSDWAAHYDPTLTVDEHRDVAERAATEGGGERLDAETSTDERLSDVEQHLDGQCDHAADHCQHGDQEACEFLEDECGISEDRVEEILDDTEEMPGDVHGLKNKLWQQYQIAVAEAKEAAAAINEINQQYRRDRTAFKELGDRKLTPDDIDWE
jgi:hypothetical protein